jgi:hypothetical protein
MRNPEPYARRRRLWPVFVPLALVLALAVVWTGLWFYAASAAEATMAGWREREAKAGRNYTCTRQTTGGFPFRIEVRCIDPGIELRGAASPLALKAADLLMAWQVYQPMLLIGEFEGPLTIADPGQPPAYRATWTLGQSSVRGTPAAPERVSLVFDQPSVERVGAGGNANVLKATRLELHGRMAAGSVRDNPVIELVLRLAAAVAPELHSVTAQPFDADITATLRGLEDFSPKPWPARFRELQARGGTIEIANARVQQGDVIAVAAGKLGLTARGGLDGQLQVNVVALDKALKAFDIDRIVSEGSVGAAIGRLDRIMPGLAQVARQNAAPNIVASLNAMGQKTMVDGKPAVTVPLRFSDGAVMLGPFPVGRVAPLF